MKNLLPTETVIFKIATKQPKNKIGEVITTYEDHEVKECLIQPGTTKELGEGFNLLQNTLLTIHIPTSFGENLVNGKAIVRGEEFTIVSVDFPLTSSPLPWNRSCIAQRSAS